MTRIHAGPDRVHPRGVPDTLLYPDRRDAVRFMSAIRYPLPATRHPLTIARPHPEALLHPRPHHPPAAADGAAVKGVMGVQALDS